MLNKVNIYRKHIFIEKNKYNFIKTVSNAGLRIS